MGDKLYNRFIEFLNSNFESNEYVLLCPENTRKDALMVCKQPENYFRSIKGSEICHKHRLANLTLQLMTKSLVFEYSKEESKNLDNFVYRAFSEMSIINPTSSEDYQDFRLPKVSVKHDRYLVFPYSLNALPRLLNDNGKIAFNYDKLKEYYEYSSERLAEFENVLIFHAKIDWSNLPRDPSKEFNMSQAISLGIGIKSQYKVILTLYPRDPQDNKSMTLVYKYSDRKPIKIQFEFNKASVVYPLIASFLYVLKNKKPALLSSKDVKEILREYNIAIPRNKSISDMGRLQKSLLEKIGDISDEKAREHLSQIFKKNGNFFRLETSFEIDKS